MEFYDWPVSLQEKGQVESRCAAQRGAQFWSKEHSCCCRAAAKPTECIKVLNCAMLSCAHERKGPHKKEQSVGRPVWWCRQALLSDRILERKDAYLTPSSTSCRQRTLQASLLSTYASASLREECGKTRPVRSRIRGPLESTLRLPG